MWTTPMLMARPVRFEALRTNSNMPQRSSGGRPTFLLFIVNIRVFKSREGQPAYFP